MPYLCKVKMRRRQQYDLINKCTYETKQAESGTGKRERMSIESADMEKIEHDRRSNPTEAPCRRKADGYEYRIMLHRELQQVDWRETI